MLFLMGAALVTMNANGYFNDNTLFLGSKIGRHLNSQAADSTLAIMQVIHGLHAFPIFGIGIVISVTFLMYKTSKTGISIVDLNRIFQRI